MLVDSHISQHPVPTNTATLRIASRLPQNIWDTLTDVQKTAIHAAITNRANNHIASLRSSIRLAGRRYYLAFFFGHERRNVERLRDEGQLDRGEVSFIYIVLGILMLIFGIMFIVLFVYMVKSLLGIDIMDGPSPLHALICR